MSIVTPKEISNIRGIERLVKQRFNRSDIPDGAEVVRKRLFFYLEQIETAKPQKNFAEVYSSTIHERFDDMDKDELIKRLIWIQLKDTIDSYQDSEDLNAGYDAKDGSRQRSGDSGSVRLFMNLGTKDGLDNNEKLIKFLAESTDMEPSIFFRVTVREMASFFNVERSAAEFIKETLSTKKFKGRKIRVDEADAPAGGTGNRKGGKAYGGSDRGGSGSKGGDRSGHFEKKGSQKFNKRY